MGRAKFAKFEKQHPQVKQPVVVVTFGRESDQWKVAGLKVE